MLGAVITLSLLHVVVPRSPTAAPAQSERMATRI
jgi:hypothetical protein